MSLTIAQQLESLQAAIANPDINEYDIPNHYETFDIIDGQNKPTGQGQALWDRFQRHLKQGYRSLTQGERLFWLTTYMGENQPDDQTLLNIVRTSTSSEIREAATTHYAAHHNEHDVTDKWHAIITDILRGVDPDSATLAEIVAPLADEQLIRITEDSNAIKAWLNTHPEASDDIIHHWLIDGWDGVVAATVQSIDPTRLPLVDIPEILNAPHYLSEQTRTAFASVARHLTVPQLETLLDRKVVKVNTMLIYGGPYTDEQMDMFDRRDHEAVENALWFYRKEAGELSRERARYFADKDSRFAARIDKSINDETYEKLHLA